MVFIRKKSSTRKSSMRRRYSKKPMSITRSVAQKVYTFKRNATPLVITPAANTVFNTLSYTFSQLPNNTEFSALFDRYKIIRIVTKIWIRNGPDAQNLNSGNNSWYPKLYWYRDTDDTTAPTSLADMRQVGRLKVKAMHPSRPIVLTCVPNILGVNYATAVTSSYTPKYKQWIDFDYRDTLHLGWKYAIDGIPSTAGNLSPYTFDFEHTYYFQCKDVL